MANQKQLDALMRGEEIWNDWREKTPTVIPELTDANLTRANLTDAHYMKTTGSPFHSLQIAAFERSARGFP
jgi:hypothetical protein